MERVVVVGAGCQDAKRLAIARRGGKVVLYGMKPGGLFSGP